MLSIYTSAKGFDTAAEDNSFNEYSGGASAPWAPGKKCLPTPRTLPVRRSITRCCP